jgi:hypothetical protein
MRPRGLSGGVLVINIEAKHRRKNMALWSEWLAANETGGSNFTEKATVNLGGSFNVYASCALSKFSATGGSPQAEMLITEYVQNGTPHEGSFNEVIGNGISSLTVALTVNNANAKGVMTVTTDR